MPQPRNPLIPVQTLASNIHTWLLSFQNRVLAKSRPFVSVLTNSLTQLSRNAAGVAQVIARSALNTFLNLGNSLLRVFDAVERLVAETLRKVVKALQAIQKSISRMISISQKVIRRIARNIADALHKLAQRVRDIVTNMNPFEIVAMIIAEAAETLQRAFPSLRQVSNLPDVLRKAKFPIVRASNQLRTQIKQGSKMVKLVDKLEPA